MIEERHIDPVEDYLPAAVKRISWGAIIAGAVTALAVQLLLGILGLGIGANSINPLQEQYPLAGLGTGAVIWFLISTVLALFAGGWVAGRLAGMPRRTDSLLTWALVTLLSFFLLTTAVGSLISGAAGVLGQGLSLAGKGVAAASPAVTSAVTRELDERGVNLTSIQQEAETLLRQTGKPELQPGNLKNKTKETGQAAQKAAGQAARNPQAADKELSSLLNRIAKSGEKTFQAADREALVNILVARTDMSRQEASNTVTRWEKMYSQTVVQYDQLKEKAGQQARETGTATAGAVTKAALWTFLILLLSALAAALGGAIGAPRDLTVIRSTRRPI